MNTLRIVANVAFAVAVVLIATDVFTLFNHRPVNAALSLAAGFCTVLAVILGNAVARQKANR